MTAAPTRDAIVAAARGWIGTPYVHGQSTRGAGCDCLGLVRGLWRDLIGAEPEPTPPYAPGWAEADGQETLLEAARRRLVQVPIEAARPGAVLLFRWRPEWPAKHCAVLAMGAPADGRMIHAYSGHDVCEVSIPHAWARRVAAAFDFPGVV